MPSRTRLLPAVVLTLIACALDSRAASAQPLRSRNVLTIHSGAVDYPANPVLEAGIRDALLSRSDAPVDYFTEYLEFDRFPDVETADALADYVRRKYDGRRIDVVIAITNRSLQFALDYHARLFPDASIVFASPGLSADTLRRYGVTEITGVRIVNAYGQTLKLALDVHPATRQVYVVASSPNPQNIDAIQTELNRFASKVPLVYLQTTSLPELLDAVRALPRGSLVLYIGFQRTGTDYVNDPSVPARQLTAAANAPVYGVIDAGIGTGIVGGMVRDTRATGYQAGRIARRILDGTPARDIPIEYAKFAAVFDWRQLHRWGIDESRLPRESDIRFKEPTLWEQYRPFIVTAMLVITAQLVLITALLTQRGRRRRAEAGLRASFERIRYLAGRLINAQEQARADIARDLHDDVCQELVGVSMTLDTLKRSAGSIDDPHTQEELARIHDWTLDIIDGVRRLSHDLHPANLRLLGLPAALRAHCVEVEKRHDVQVALTTDGDCRKLPEDVAVSLFRIAQEALRNGAVHGDARRLIVSVVRSGAAVELIVTDDGRGFDVDAVRLDGGGLGLISIEERARIVGGTARIVSQPRQGTTLAVQVPLPVAAEARTPDRRLPAHPGLSPAVARLQRAAEALNREVSGARALVRTSVSIAADGTSNEKGEAEAVAVSSQKTGTL